MFLSDPTGAADAVLFWVSVDEVNSRGNTAMIAIASEIRLSLANTRTKRNSS